MLSTNCKEKQDNPDVSIIIVNWNTKELLRQCLKSLYDIASNVRFEVYVVDNNSSDGSTEMVKRDFPQIKLIENRQNEGFARANNKAMYYARGRYILLLNSDTVVLDQAFDKMLAYMDEHRDAGVLGCRLINKEGSLQVSAAWFSTLATALLGSNIVPRALAGFFRMKKFPGQNFLTNRSHEEIQDVDWVVGACMLVRHEIIHEVGLLDEKLFIFGEEIEWCFRIKKRGWRIIYFPDAKLIHYGGGSAKESSKISAYRRVFAERYIYHKHHNVYLSGIYDFLIFTMAMVKVPLWGISLLTFYDNENKLIKLYYQWAIFKIILYGKRGDPDILK